MMRMGRKTLEEGLRAVEGIMAKYVEDGWKRRSECGVEVDVLDEVEGRWYPFLLGGMRQRLLEELMELERREKADGGKG